MRKLSLKTQLFILFWLPAGIFLLVMFYYPLKKGPVIIKKEIKIPEEHRQFVEALNRLEGVKKREMAPFEISKNPFYEEKPLKTLSTTSSESLHLTSIFRHEKRACVINGKLYHEGDKIGRMKISKIGDYYVEILLPTGKKIRLEVGGVFTLTSLN